MDQALKIDAETMNKAEALTHLAEVYFHEEKLPEAIAHCQQAIKISPNFPQAYQLLAEILLGQNRNQAAFRAYLKIVELHPNSAAEIYLNIGTIFAKKGRLDEAITCSQKALSLQPNFAEAYVNLGIIFRQQGKLDEAINSYRQAIAINPNLINAYLSLGHAFLQQGNLEEAVNSYRNSIARQPDWLEAYLSLGHALNQQQKFEEAIACYITALQIQPYLFEAYQNLGDILQQQGKLHEAKTCYSQNLPISLIQQFSKSPPTWTVTSKLDPNHQITYIDIHPPTSHSLSPPKTPDGKVHHKFQQSDFQAPATFVAIVPDGQAFGYASTRSILTSKHQLVEDLSTGISALLASAKQLPPLVNVQGTLALISAENCPNYFHWMSDLLPRIELIRRSGILLQNIDQILVNTSGLPVQQETLTILGIPQNKILKIEHVFHVKAQKLFVTSPTCNRGFMPQWVCDFLRKEFLGIAKCFNQPSRIYIARKNAKYRRVINENKIIEILSQLGFISVSLESMSLADQISWFANAQVVVAPHGAGLTNTVFCQPGTKIIEFFAPEYIPGVYHRISNLVGLKYYYLMGEPLDKNHPFLSQTYSFRQNKIGYEDILINIQLLLELLNFAGVSSEE